MQNLQRDGANTNTVNKAVLNPGESESVANYQRIRMQDDMEWSTEQKRLYDRESAQQDALNDWEPSNLEVFAAAFERDNEISAWVSQTPLSKVPDVAGYSPFNKNEDGSTDIDGYEPYATSFVDSFNPQTTAEIKARIDRQKVNQSIIENGGGVGIAASVAAGLASPINLAAMLVPGYGQGNTLKTVGTAITTGAAAASVQEMALHSLQETRTLNESVFNVAATAILDGTLAFGISKYLNRDQLIKETADHLDSNKSIGAAQAPYGEATGETLKKGWLTKPVFLMAKASPVGRLLQSDNQTARAAAQDLVESKFEIEGDYTPSSVESLINLDYAKYGISEQKVAKLEREYSKAGGDKDSFTVELANAMRNGDYSENEFVAKAAKELRTHIDNTWNRAAQNGVEGTFTIVDGEKVPIKTTTAASYMTRRKDINAIRNNPEGYKQAWINGLKDRHARYTAQALEDGLPAPKPYDDEVLREIANEIYERDINLTVGELHFATDHPKIPTQTKQRVDIKDEFLDEFLVKDWRSLMDGYMKSMAPKARLSERFGDFRMKDQIERIDQDLKISSAPISVQISKAKTSKEKKALNKQLDKLQKKAKSDVDDIQGILRRITNEVKPPSMENPINKGTISALRSIRSFNVASMLGSVVVSSIPDLSRAIAYNGGFRYVKAFAKNFNTASIRRSNISNDQMGKFAQAIEKTQAIRVKEYTNVDDTYVATPADRYASWIAQKSMTFAGLQHWNGLNKGVAASLYGDKIAESLIKGTNRSKFKQLGLQDWMIDEAQEQAKKHATKEGGLYTLNLDNWDIDVTIQEIIEAGAIKESNFLVTTPGAGDLPLFMDGDLAKSLLQFQSFAIASTNRLLVPLVQEGGVRPLAEVATHMVLGYAAYALKETAANREVTKDPKMATWEAVNHTGLLGYAAELYRRQYSMTGVDPTGIMHKDRKYFIRGPWGAWLGPSAGTIDNIRKAAPINTMVGAEQKARAMRRLMPLNNHFLLRKSFDKIEEETAKVIPDKVKVDDR